MNRLILILALAFTGIGARNPFEPPPFPSARKIVRDSLVDYTLSQLKVTGVIWNTQTPVALFEAFDRKTYTATIGTDVGKKGGKVVKIDDKIVIVQGKFGIKTFKIHP